jgi:predicted RNA-binding Zn-ribbon protein involved in translation (DUF1610 family)
VAKARSLRAFQTSFPDETSCAAFLFEQRWPQGFVCPACGDGRAAFLRSRAQHLRMPRLRSPDVDNGRDGDAPVEVAADARCRILRRPATILAQPKALLDAFAGCAGRSHSGDAAFDRRCQITT